MASPVETGPIEFELEGTYFTVDKMLAEEQFQVWEILRPGLGEAIKGLDVAKIVETFSMLDADDVAQARRGNTTAQARLGGLFVDNIIRLGLTIPPATMSAARRELFGTVTVNNRHTNGPVGLPGNEPAAFFDMDGIDIYEVILRVFWANFSGSFIKLFDRLSNRQDMIKTMVGNEPEADPNSEADSQPSSDRSSPPDS